MRSYLLTLSALLVSPPGLYAAQFNYLDADYAKAGFGFGDDQMFLEGMRTLEAPVIRRALAIRDEMAQGNYFEIKQLVMMVTEAFHKAQMTEAELSTRLTKMLAEQASVVKDIHQEGALHKAWPYTMRFEIAKLVTRDVYGKAAVLMQKHLSAILRGEFPEHPARNSIVELKYALIHLLLVLDPDFQLFPFMEKANLFYPVSIAEGARVQELRLFDKDASCLWLPNAGYIMSGDPVAGKIRGTDCSGFIKLIFGSPHHLTTKDFASIVQCKRGLLHKEDLSSLAVSEFENYETVTPTDLAPGDLVVWRWQKGSETLGHVVVFAGWTKAYKRFLSLEVAMLPELNLDAAGARDLALVREGTELFLLRRVTL